MVSQIRHPEWRESLEDTKYPFESGATLLNATGKSIPPDIFLDAHLYPIGADANMYLSRVEVTSQKVTLHVGDISSRSIATGTIDFSSPVDSIRLTDSFGRPAGIFVSEASRLGIFRAFGMGTHEFSASASSFVAGVCMPTPQVGVRGVQLEDGSLLAGPVWLVGEDGVVVSRETVEDPATCDTPAQTHEVIRVDAVGDPLFRRRLCTPKELFSTPSFIKKIKIVNGEDEWLCEPDVHGYFTIQGNDSLAGDAALRVRITPEGNLEFQVEGSSSAAI